MINKYEGRNSDVTYTIRGKVKFTFLIFEAKLDLDMHTITRKSGFSSNYSMLSEYHIVFTSYSQPIT